MFLRVHKKIGQSWSHFTTIRDPSPSFTILLNFIYTKKIRGATFGLEGDASLSYSIRAFRRRTRSISFVTSLSSKNNAIISDTINI